MSTPLIGEIHYLRVPVTDLESAVRWYTECLGFQHAWTTEDMAMVKLVSGQMLVLQKADAGSYSHFTKDGQPVESITFTSAEIRRLHQHLINNGVQVDEIKEDGHHLLFHFFDPDGNKFQVHW